jgi:predicted flavoprotein YhiN
MRKDPSPSTAPALSRRTVFMGAGAAGAVGAIAAATAVSRVQPVPAPSAGSVAAGSGGYQLTDHVKQYYATARI